MTDDARDGWTLLGGGSRGRSEEGPALVVALEATDAPGRAAVGAAGLLRSLGDGVLTASMPVDEWVDPRVHPPVADVEQGLLCAVAWPALEVRPGTDRHGRPWALVQGPVPTTGWRAFAEALARLAAALQARAVVAVASVAAPVPAVGAEDHVVVVGAATESALLAGVERMDPARTPPSGPEIAVAGALAHRGIPALAAYAVVTGHGGGDRSGRAGPVCPTASALLVTTAAEVLGLALDVPAPDRPDERGHAIMSADGVPSGGVPSGGVPVRTSDALVDEVEHYLRATGSSGRDGSHQRSRGEDTP